MLYDLSDGSTKTKVINMIKVYRNEIQPMITGALKQKFPPSATRLEVEQTKFIWFSKEDVLQFLGANPDSNGVRIYFAAYNETTSPQGSGHSEYEGQLTVMLVPTEADDNGNNDLNSSDMMQGKALNFGSHCLPDCPRGPGGGTTLLFA